jgi:hypothetical protein
LFDSQFGLDSTDSTRQHSLIASRRREWIGSETGSGPHIHFVAEGLAWMFEAWRHHAHDGVKIAVSVDLPAKNVWIRTEKSSPQPVTDHNSFRKSLSLILRAKNASKLRVRAEQREIVRTHGNQFDPLGSIRAGEICVHWPNC